MPEIASNHPTSATALAPTMPAHATAAKCIAAWVDLMDTCDQFLLAGLRREIGPDGDLRAACRQWLDRHMQDHDRMMLRMIERFNRVEGGHAG
jgi:hypothetical protein